MVTIVVNMAWVDQRDRDVDIGEQHCSVPRPFSGGPAAADHSVALSSAT
ncbi:hypothetical protein [Microbacterium sp. TNHR37B]|nr:hypothetical protein [Microbacterium sp. TNHR37B]